MKTTLTTEVFPFRDELNKLVVKNSASESLGYQFVVELLKV